MLSSLPKNVYCRELDHDIISILNLGGINQEETSSVLEEDFDEEEDDEYEPNNDDDVVGGARSHQSTWFTPI